MLGKVAGAVVAVLLVSLVSKTVDAQRSGSPGVQVASRECLICQVAVVHIMMADDTGVSNYRCFTDETQESDGKSEMSYSINLPMHFVNRNKVMLDSGVSTICIVGGSAIRTEFGKPDYVVIPPNADIHFVASRNINRQRRLTQTFGSRTVLVVLVKAPDSLQSNSVRSLANGTFGIGGQQYSVASQYSSCSAGKLNFIPASGYPTRITNGVINIALPSSINDIYISDLENSMKIAAKVLLGINDLNNHFSHIMFCMPRGTKIKGNDAKTWSAYGITPGQYSYYNNNWCKSLSAKMHELGHNLGLQHSNENGITYDDRSCMMGYSYYDKGSPAMCFNGHKNFVLGWYADKQITVNPTTTSGAWSGKLVGFVDYMKASIDRNEYVLIISGNLYIQYNLAKGFNFQVQEKANMVTIATAPNSKSISTLLLSLSAKQFVVIDSYVIEACETVDASSTAPKYVELSVRLETQSSTCPNAKLVPMQN